MSGRNKKPLALHIIEGKSHLTNAEIEEREENESKLKFGTHDFKAPREVRSDRIAHMKWKEIINLYTSNKIDFVTTADTTILMQYCLTYSEYMYLIKARKEILNKGWDAVKTYHAIDELGLEHNINKKNALLTKLGKSLFLDPQSRINAIPGREPVKKKKTPLEMKFGNV
jgi:phage terminase small subunit